MPPRFMATFLTIAALALLNVVIPEPMVFDLLGVSLASVGLGMMFDGGIGY